MIIISSALIAVRSAEGREGEGTVVAESKTQAPEVPSENKIYLAFWVLIVICFLGSPLNPVSHEANAGTPQVGKPEQTIVLDARKLSTMQKELDQAAAAGYRMKFAETLDLEVGVRASETKGTVKTRGSEEGYSFTTRSTEISVHLDEIQVTMVKQGEPPGDYQYKVFSASRASTMEKELNRFGDQGFRLIPESATKRKTVIGVEELVLIMERSIGSAIRYRYTVLATDRESTLQKEIDLTRKGGFNLRSVLLFRQRLAFMEKTQE